MTGRKSAILVGCDYNGSQNDRRYGCANDVRIIEGILRSFDFDQANITTLEETINPPDLTNQPTLSNIENELRRMIEVARDEDVLFFYFSGLVKRNQSNSIPGILSSDHQLVPASVFDPKANKLPKKTRFYLVLESSDSGDFINPVEPDDNRILFSACQVSEKSKRVAPDVENANAEGMFTHAIQMALHERHPPRVTNEQLYSGVNACMRCYHQHAGLRCNDNNRNAPFLG